MNDKINMLVQETLDLAPELKEKEGEVRKLVELLLQSKPDVQIDESFVRELRVQLCDKVQFGQLKNLRKENNKISIMNIINNKFAYAIVVVVFTVIAVSPFLDLGGSVSDNAIKLAFEPTIADVKSNGFGDLTSAQQGKQVNESQEASFGTPQATQDSNGDFVTEEIAMMESAGDGFSSTGVTSVEPTVIGITSDLGDDSSMRIMPPWQYQYPRYVFKGDFPNIPQKASVYRKNSSPIDSSGLTAIVEELNLGIVDMGTFNNVKVQRFEVVSGGDPAYTISIDFDNGTLSIYKSWDDDIIYLEHRGIDSGDINESKIIKIANDFLKKHNVDISSYGEPELDIPNYMTYADTAEISMEKSSEMFAPIYSVQVRYPRLIDGIKVVEYSGSPIGISVSVNTGSNYVESVWGLETLSLDRSQYPLITDEETLLTMIESGGYGGRYWVSSGESSQVDVEVNNPEIVLMKYWKYGDKRNSNPEELFVPALMFDVDRGGGQRNRMYVNKHIIVPLVEGIIQDDEMPVPMPLMESGTASVVLPAEEVDAILIEN